jgi:hypothetical protein
MTWLRCRYSCVVWVQGLEADMAEGWVSHHVWDWCGAVAWHSPRGREPGRMEQQLCRPMGQGFGRPAILLLDHGMEKPYTI